MLKIKIKKNNRINSSHSDRSKGFSIGEILLSLFILSFVLVLMTNLLVKSILHSTDSRDRIVASQLAQEGVELVRNVRDNNWANGDGMCSAGFPNNDNNKCVIDRDDAGSVCNNTPPVDFYDLKIDSESFFSHNNGTATKFKRKIEIDYNGASCNAAGTTQVTITSMVVWGEEFPVGGINNCNVANKCAYAQSVLTKWGE